MDLQRFLRFTHDGAFFVFRQIVRDLSNNDLKSLRLCLEKDVSDLLFPYMFERLFFSFHQEDLDVFQHIANHPTASQSVTEIMWNGSFIGTPLASDRPVWKYEDSQRLYAYFLNRSRGVELCTPGHHLTMMDELESNWDAYVQATEFWVGRERVAIENAVLDSDLRMLHEYLSRLKRLSKITILSETGTPKVPLDCYLDLWNSPRARRWAKLPFFKFLPSPRPWMPYDWRRTHRRVVDCLKSLCQDRLIEVKAISIELFGRDHVLRRLGGFLNHPDDFPEDVHADLERVLLHGPASTPTYQEKAGGLTLRFMNQLGGRAHDIEATCDHMLSCIDDLAIECVPSLSTLMYAHMPLMDIIDHATFARDTLTAAPSLLKACSNIRTLHLHNCWCPDMTLFLSWISTETSITKIEMNAVESSRKSWYNVMMDLRRQGVEFDGFDVVSCRSRSELWGPGFGPDILAPWNGESKDTVPWLRGKTSAFPLWQGPG